MLLWIVCVLATLRKSLRQGFWQHWPSLKFTFDDVYALEWRHCVLSSRRHFVYHVKEYIFLMHTCLYTLVLNASSWEWLNDALWGFRNRGDSVLIHFIELAFFARSAILKCLLRDNKRERLTITCMSDKPFTIIWHWLLIFIRRNRKPCGLPPLHLHWW